MSAPPARSPARALFDDALGSLGKVVAAVAGAGLFLYLIGTAVTWQRVDEVGLQAQEVVAVIPRDQLAVAGAREALLSLLAAVIFGYFLYVCYRVFRASQQVDETDGVRGQLARWMRERPALVVTTVVGVGFAPIVPFDENNALFFAIFLLNLFLGARSAQRSLIGDLPRFGVSLRPWLRVVAGLGIAVFLVSVWRPTEFPEPFPIARVSLADATPAELAEDASALDRPCDRYVGLTSDAVILARAGSCTAQTTQAVVVARAKIAQIKLRAAKPDPPTLSLLGLLTSWDVTCVAPVCQVGSDRLNLLRPFDAVKTKRPER